MNFGGHEVVYSYPQSRIVMLPVPYDETSTWIRGADKGPDAIFKASVNLEFYDIETGTEVHKNGIFTLDPVVEKSSPEALTEEVRKRVKQLLDEQKFPVIVGGNHTVSIGAFYAFSEKYRDLSILQLDAHSDLRNEYEGSALNHACVMARAREKAHIVQVGIRSMSAEEASEAGWENIYPAHELIRDNSLYLKAAASLKEKVYVTIDMDVFDPSLVPSTGTPEPGGPDYSDLMNFLRHVADKRNIVGFDVVELCPSDANHTPDFVAAKVIYQFLSYIFSGGRQ
ncbi:MAG TPA: agmatinase [Bacteroidales bacterium]|nr:agmatinase [Bacteroidales bacterium]HRR92803.1 agmatinase [Bacteroidales bacterium]